MKFIKSFLFVLVLTFFTACDNEPIDPALNSQISSDPNNPNNPLNGIFKADFDGQTFTTSNVQCIFANGILVLDATRLPQDDSFSFVMDQVAVGTFAAKDHLITYQPAGTEYGYWTQNLNNPSEDLGSVVITNINTVDKKISGTFTFKGYWSNTSVNLPSKTFTNGSFTNIPYSTDLPPEDTFSANLNGAVFTNPTIAVSEVTVGTQTFISIAGLRTNDRINVNILETTGVGNYPITGANTDVVQGFYSITSPVYSQRANLGLVTITEKTATRIKGTFNFTTPNTPIPYIITSGNFDVELP
jgi:hypothetical protein